MTRKTNQQQGMTLVELMVVGAIVGLLGSMATAVGSSKPNVNKTAQLLSIRIADAAREARAAGPVTQTVIDAELDGTRRSQLVITGAQNAQYFSVELRRETDSVSSEYTQVGIEYVGEGIEIVGFEAVARTDPSGTATPPELGDDFTFACQPSGGCGPATFYLQDVDATNKYRVVVLPLSSGPLVMKGW